MIILIDTKKVFDKFSHPFFIFKKGNLQTSNKRFFFKFIYLLCVCVKERERKRERKGEGSVSTEPSTGLNSPTTRS